MSKKITGPRVDFIELKFKKPLEDLLMPYLIYEAPVTKIAKALGAPEPTVRYWVRVMKANMKKEVGKK